MATPSTASGLGTLTVHLVRHAAVASHRGDIPITAAGRERALALGRELAAGAQPGEHVAFAFAPRLRARETAGSVRAGMADALGSQETLGIPAVSWALRTTDVFVAGERIELMSSAEAIAEQLPHIGLTTEDVMRIPFLAGFLETPDRLGFWLEHPDPPGEDAACVARRMLHYALSLTQRPRSGPPVRHVCITHSGNLRALLRRSLLEEDPGEPDPCESVDVVVAGDGRATIGFRDRECVLTSAGGT